jgi:uncharacterized repeat protein (TIGR03833 family)
VAKKATFFYCLCYNQKEVMKMNNGQKRNEIFPGLTVEIVLKKDQRTGKLTKGMVKDILTNSQNHPRGIKVRLADGQIGRVQKTYP